MALSVQTAPPETPPHPARRGVWPRMAYGVVFCVALPAFLLVWARRLDELVALPRPLHFPLAGGLIAAAGLALLAAAMVALWRRGGGLPMNAFPPVRLVSDGLYGLMPHPIYVGFVVACAGCAVCFGSAAGLFLVTPLAALAAAALWWGYERRDVQNRFGTLVRPRISLPKADDDKPTTADSLGAILRIFPLWLVCYETPFFLGLPAWTLDARLAIEKTWPVMAWMEPLYASAYLVPLTLLLAPTRRALRRFGIQAFLAIGFATLCYLVLPVISPPRPHSATGLLGFSLDIERALSDPPVGAFPSFHAIWALLAAELLARRSRTWALAGWIWALGVAAACITTGMHALADILAGFVTYLALRHYDALYAWLLRGTQHVANSWRAWRVGPVRIIHHGIFAGVGGFIGVLVTTWLSGHLGWTLAVAATGLVASAVWAQTVEGSPTLLRPFGYYGFLVGALLALVVCFLVGGPALELLGAGTVAAPWVQALGRLRCLVQGCCHGRPTDARLGIRVHEPHSRVTKLDHLAGVSLHPTQLYSILGNLVIGLLLARLWSLGMPLSMIGGLYLVLSGLARFVEEAYRGEPQTPVYARLAIYQWMALGGLVVGAALTCVASPPAAFPSSLPDAPTLAAAAGAFVVFFLAMAVDLPDSRVRFTRLSG
jgi:protein-S-isoprenylcysteine O-methyltransferase Ste14